MPRGLQHSRHLLPLTDPSPSSPLPPPKTPFGSDPSQGSTNERLPWIYLRVFEDTRSHYFPTLQTISPPATAS